ncbi:MAG: GntR family transcriptional regulator [Pseudomonadota bacterium]
MTIEARSHRPLNDEKPLYAQIAEQFEAEIRNGLLKPGDRLESQAELMRRFGVSQATVRQALLNLSNQGLVIARQGKGVFVAEPRVSIELSQTDVAISGKATDLEYELIASDLLAAPDRMAAFLAVDPGSHILRCRRKLRSGGRHIGIETANLPLDVLQSVPHDVLSTQDLRQFFNRSDNWRADQSTFWLSAGLVSAFDAELLGIEADRIVLQREEVTIDAGAGPILMTRSVFLADLVSLSGNATLGRLSA